MKVKGASFFELHIEKIVLAVVAAFFVAVLVIQLGAEGPAVTVNNQKLPLDQAYEPAEELARQARVRMNTQQPVLPEVGEQVDLLGRFQQARAADLAPRDRIAFGPTIALGDMGDAEGFGNSPFVELVIPPPSEPVAYSFAATLDPWAVKDTEGLAALVGPSQPYDKSAVSVQAVYDSAAFVEALSAEPAEEGVRAWPMTWWRGMEILAVKLERQRQNSDGSWGDVEQVASPPGMLDLPAELAETEDLAPRHIKAMVEDVQRNLAQRVRRPAFYPIIAGDPWVEPREGARLVSLEAGAQPEVAMLQRRLAGIDEGMAADEQELAALQGPGQRQGDRAPTDRAREAQIRRIEGRLESRRRQREQVVAELTALGHPPEEPEPEPGDRRGQDQRFGRQAEVESLYSGGTIEVWAHDVTAEPGATYRYRVVLEMNHPAFGQAQFLVEEQRSLASQPTADSVPSEWTQPVLVAPMSAFFVTGANEAQQGAMGTRLANANVEIFTFLYGYYRKATANLEPGDPVAGWAELPEGLPIFNVEEPPPAGGPAMPAPVAEAEQRRRGEAPPAGDVVPVRSLASAQAYLLDVYESAAREVGAVGQARPPRIVMFGNPAGEVLSRRVGEDRRSSLYSRLNASAEAGQTQGQPEPEPEQQQQEREPPPLPPPPVEGGGGGGGGGG